MTTPKSHFLNSPNDRPTRHWQQARDATLTSEKCSTNLKHWSFQTLVSEPLAGVWNYQYWQLFMPVAIPLDVLSFDP